MITTNRHTAFTLLGIVTLACLYTFMLVGSEATEKACGSARNRIMIPDNVWQKYPDQNAYRVYWGGSWQEIPSDKVVGNNHTLNAVIYFRIDHNGNPAVDCFLPPRS